MADADLNEDLTESKDRGRLHSIFLTVSPRWTRSKSRSRSNSIVGSQPTTPITPTTPSRASSRSSISTQEFHGQLPSIDIEPNAGHNGLQALVVLTTRSGHHSLAAYLDTYESINLLMVSKRLACSEACFKSYFEVNGWDVETLFHKLGKKEGLLGVHATRVASQRRSILKLHERCMARPTSKDEELLKEKAKRQQKKEEKELPQAKRLLRILVECALEHDQNNFPELVKLAASKDMSFIRFVDKIPAVGWKAHYQKFFILAAFINSRPVFLEEDKDLLEVELSKFISRVDFDEKSKDNFHNQARACFMYAAGSFLHPDNPSWIPIRSEDYESTNSSMASKWERLLPGVGRAVHRFESPQRLQGVYASTKNGDETFIITTKPKPSDESHGLLSVKKNIPFLKKDETLFTAAIEQSTPEGVKAWEMQGTINRETGEGSIEDKTMVYPIWATPWGIIGTKVRRTDKVRLGTFFLQWSAWTEEPAAIPDSEPKT